jgi:hypothetical protein
MKPENRGRHALIFSVLVLLISLLPPAMADPNPSTEMPVVLSRRHIVGSVIQPSISICNRLTPKKHGQKL